jgi:hypothetical protein
VAFFRPNLNLKENHLGEKVAIVSTLMSEGKVT